jgi:hypothetical protein
MDTFLEQNEQNEPPVFYCDKCDYKCFKKYNYNRHILTDKHKKIHSGYILDTFLEQNEQKEQCYLYHTIKYKCECGKHYKYSQGLSKHKKTCNKSISQDNEPEEQTTDKDLIMLLIKENSELKNMVLEVCQKIQPLTNTVNSHNTNSHNKTFNLNVFLNETCKDAMNITDFVDSLKLQLSDLESVGKLGYVNGISNIIVKNLNSLDETKRPIHCTDTKRETIYIKDQDKWEKENQENVKLKKVIKRIANKNSRLLPAFREKYPDCDIKNSEQYNKLIIEAMGGLGSNDIEKEDKIIKKIIKEVTINKANYID